MGVAVCMAMSVRPSLAATLCFETSGILGAMFAQLGQAVSTFDVPAFSSNGLGAFPTTAGDASRLLYDSQQIDTYVQPSVLASLRAEPRKLALNKAINARQNAYYAKYMNAPAIIAQINQLYSPSVANSKMQRLTGLSGLAQQQSDALYAAYTTDSRTGVVKVTQSTLSSTTTTTGSTNESGQSVSQAVGDQIPPGVLIQLPPGGNPVTNFGFTGGNLMTEDDQDSTSGSISNSQATASQSQYISNTDYGYRVPAIESVAQNERAQISLNDEWFKQFMATQNLPNLAQVYANELNSIDSDVCRLQVDYLNTILLPSIPGMITGIYKSVGEWVRAGEPVIRIENAAQIYIVATLQYDGAIAIYGTVTIATQRLEIAGTPTTLTGIVVQARGGADDNQWELVLACGNLDSSGAQIFPSGYVFAADATTVTVN
jgi:hypothetical protein